MGLSIHYSGRLKSANLLPNLIEEVQDVAKVYDWKYHIYETTFPNDKFSNETAFDEIYGISFTPTDCETISIAFLSNGAMVCPARVQFLDNSESIQERNWIYTNSVKTQYAGIKTHQFIILFLKYLNGKYFHGFELFDESDYWETNDEEKMKRQFQKYDTLIDNFVLAIETLPARQDENLFAYLERIIKNVNNLNKDKN